MKWLSPLMYSRTTDSPTAAKSAEFPFRLAPRLAACALLTATGFVCMAADVAVVEEIVAKVNGDIVTRGELEQRRKQLEADVKQQSTTQISVQHTVEERAKDILRNRIDELL